MRLKIAILAGDGIGPEVTNEAVNILKAVAEFGGHDFTFVPLLLGGVAITATGSPRPSKPASNPTPSSSEPSATTSSTTSPPTSAPKPACSRSARPSADSPTCAPPSPIPRSRKTRHCALK
jgi:isocitrate/isopropylmalate dehydrogenase